MVLVIHIFLTVQIIQQKMEESLSDSGYKNHKVILLIVTLIVVLLLILIILVAHLVARL